MGAFASLQTRYGSEAIGSEMTGSRRSQRLVVPNGALAQCTDLRLGRNRYRDDGMNALPNLNELQLQFNQVSDGGIALQALAGAVTCVQGARGGWGLASLELACARHSQGGRVSLSAPPRVLNSFEPS